jgi:poly-gamma-glutamate capsule biosynthesis protein CapA/YwtB (metallophosphatase superfamily)
MAMANPAYAGVSLRPTILAYPQPPSPQSFTLALTGDTLIHMGISRAAARHGSPYDFRPMFEPVRHLISGADLAICHVEVPLDPESASLSTYPRFNAPRAVADALAYAGFDGCSTASNHSLDRGISGILGTLQVLEDAGLGQAGMWSDVLSSWDDTVYEVAGARVAHISATYWFNGLRLPPDRAWMAQLLDVEDILARARRAKLYGADLVVVSMHCCTEYRTMPTARQLETSHTLIDSPHVDLVVTHHSHVVGPVERVGDQFILHGMGNFISGQFSLPNTSDGVIAVVTANRHPGGWKFDQVEVVPTAVSRGSYAVVPAPEGSPSFQRTMGAINAMGAGIEVFAGHAPADVRLDLAD